MVNTEGLITAIRESGLKFGFIAEKVGCSENSLRNKIYGRTEFTVHEADRFCEVVGITSLRRKQSLFSC